VKRRDQFELNSNSHKRRLYTLYKDELFDTSLTHWRRYWEWNGELASHSNGPYAAHLLGAPVIRWGSPAQIKYQKYLVVNQLNASIKICIYGNDLMIAWKRYCIFCVQMLVHSKCRVNLNTNKKALTGTNARLTSIQVTSQLFINSALTSNLSKT
jgi:hypothetical protein